MSKLVTLRKSGNSLILTAPADLKMKLAVNTLLISDRMALLFISQQPKRIFLITRIGYSMTTKRT